MIQVQETSTRSDQFNSADIIEVLEAVTVNNGVEPSEGQSGDFLKIIELTFLDLPFQK